MASDLIKDIVAEEYENAVHNLKSGIEGQAKERVARAAETMGVLTAQFLSGEITADQYKGDGRHATGILESVAAAEAYRAHAEFKEGISRALKRIVPLLAAAL